MLKNLKQKHKVKTKLKTTEVGLALESLKDLIYIITPIEMW